MARNTASSTDGSGPQRFAESVFADPNFRTDSLIVRWASAPGDYRELMATPEGSITNIQALTDKFVRNRATPKERDFILRYNRYQEDIHQGRKNEGEIAREAGRLAGLIVPHATQGVYLIGETQYSVAPDTEGRDRLGVAAEDDLLAVFGLDLDAVTADESTRAARIVEHSRLILDVHQEFVAATAE